MLKKAYVEITNRCNLACSFCPKTKRAPRTMSAQEFDLILSRLEGYVQYVYLHVMGEPLLHPELTTLFALAKARNMKICITTNGTLLQKRSSELLAAESLHKISVSLHSFEGNDGADEQELAYLEQVWDFAEKAAKKGVIVALRLWNDGGADARNGEILDFLRSRTGDNWCSKSSEGETADPTAGSSSTQSTTASRRESSRVQRLFFIIITSFHF